MSGCNIAAGEDNVRDYLAIVNTYFLGVYPILCGQVGYCVGSLKTCQMTYRKALYSLGFLGFVGHIVIGLCIAMQKIYVILNSYIVAYGARRLRRDPSFLKNDPQTPFFAVTL